MSDNTLVKLFFMFLFLIVLGAMMNMGVAVFKLGQISGWW